MWELGQAALRAAYHGSDGMTSADVTAGGNGMGRLWLLFAGEAPALLALAWYLEHVTDSGVGVRRHWLFPLHSLADRCASVCHAMCSLWVPEVEGWFLGH